MHTHFGALISTVLMLAPAMKGPPRDNPPRPTQQNVRPTWQVGDQWTVKTSTPAVQTGLEPGQKPRISTVRWQFQVQAIEKQAGSDCFRVEVRHDSKTPQPPRAILWVDQKSYALRQVQVQLPAPGGKTRTLTESYAFAGGQAAPVLGPLTALPLDMPLFLPEGAKDIGTFTYEAVPGASGEKALDEIGFVFSVEQQFSEPNRDGVKSLLAEPYAKALGEVPTTEVRLKGPGRAKIRQLWQAGSPWPVFTDNGLTTAKLINVQRAALPEEKP